MTRREISPAMMGSVALHAAVAAALLISWRHPRDLQIGSVTPVTIVSNAPAAELSSATADLEAQAAQAEAPAPDAPSESAPAEPQPAPPTPSPEARTSTRAEKSLDLDALAASVSKLARPAGPSSAAKGPSQAETALRARTGAGSAAAAAALSGLADELQRRWNPNCAVAEARGVVVAVTFRLNSGGGVIGAARAQLVQGAPSAATRVAADRAVSAVYAAAPFRNLPREVYGQPIRVNFDARKACS